jgi:glycolate oxidase FAD binding subunit
MVASVGAGLALGALQERLGRARQRWPVDPPGGAPRTVGGVLATGASGPLRFRYGTARDLLLGVRFVQADGTITWGGARVVKSVTGYDVPKLFVGSLGTLGVVVEATLRLHPVPPAEATWLFPFASSERAAAFLAALLDTAIEPARVALLDAQALAAAGLGGGRSVTEPAAPAAPGEPGPAVQGVAVSIESVPEAVESQGAALAGLAAAHGGQGGRVSAALWPALGLVLAAPIRLKLAGPIPRLGFWLDETRRLASALDVGIAAVGEAGSGVLWLALTGPASAAELQRRVLAPLRSALAEEGGTLVVERAPATIKADLDVWGPVPPEALAIMARLKREFDPDGILNPGRFVGGL